VCVGVVEPDTKLVLDLMDGSDLVAVTAKANAMIWARVHPQSVAQTVGAGNVHFPPISVIPCSRRPALMRILLPGPGGGKEEAGCRVKPGMTMVGRAANQD